MKVGDFRRIISSYGDQANWYVTPDGDKLIDIQAEAVQNLQVCRVNYLGRTNAFVLCVQEANPIEKMSIASEIAYRLNTDAYEVVLACKAVGIDLLEMQRQRDENKKKTDSQRAIREQLSQMAKAGLFLTSAELQSQMEQMVSTFQQPQKSA